MRDKYDEAIERLAQSNGPALEDAWVEFSIRPDGCLFQFITASGRSIGAHLDCGCLTMIRSGSARAEPESLNRSIRRDPRVPDGIHELAKKWGGMSGEERRESLQIFSEWQRAVDATIRAGKPWHDDFTPRREQPAETRETVKI